MRVFGFSVASSVALAVFALGSGCKSDKPAATAGSADQQAASAAAAPSQAPAAAAAPAASPATAPTARACSIIPAEELKMAVGIESEGKPSTSGGADVCTWFGERGRAIVLQVYGGPSAYEGARGAFERQFRTKGEDVADVGDRSFYLAGKMGALDAATVVAQKGSTPISVQVMEAGGQPEKLKAYAIEVARSVLRKL